MIRRRWLLAAAALAGLAIAAVAVALLRGGGERPPASAAARLVPAGALAYVHVSTDEDRAGVRRAGRLLGRLPGLVAARDDLVGRLTSIGPGLSYRRDVRPWLGAEAAIALLDAPGATAAPVAVLSVSSRTRAQAFLDRASAPPDVASYRGVRIATYGALTTAFLGRFLLAGPDSAVRAAIDAGRGGSPSLARDPVFRRASAGLPAGRAADAFLSRAGVIRVLLEQRGVLGAAGSLLAQPALAGTAMALSARDDGAALRVQTVLDPRAAGPRPPAFEPRLAGAVPAGALGYLGVAGLDRSARPLLGSLAGSAAPGVAALLARLQAQAGRSGVDLRRDLLGALHGEVAIWLKAASPAPALTLIAATRDERATREAMARLAGSISTALARPGGAPAPLLEERGVAGASAFVLRLGPAAELDYAVFDGKLVISTSLAALRDVRRPRRSLTDVPGFKATLDGRPARVTSLVFLDFSQLLALGERSGLSRSPAYAAVRADLRRVKAVGAASSGGKRESTTDVFLLIP